MPRVIVCLCALCAALVLLARLTEAQTKPAPSAAVTAGPATAPAAGKATVIYEAGGEDGKRAHMEPVPDPFGGAGVAAKATRGHHEEQQLVFNGDFFALPADGAGQAVVFRLGVNGPTSVRIVFSTKDKSMSQTLTLPQEGKWCDMEVPLPAVVGRLGAGEMVVDITLFQKDPAGTGKLFVKSISLVSTDK